MLLGALAYQQTLRDMGVFAPADCSPVSFPFFAEQDCVPAIKFLSPGAKITLWVNGEQVFSGWVEGEEVVFLDKRGPLTVKISSCGPLSDRTVVGCFVVPDIAVEKRVYGNIPVRVEITVRNKGFADANVTLIDSTRYLAPLTETRWILFVPKRSEVKVEYTAVPVMTGEFSPGPAIAVWTDELGEHRVKSNNVYMKVSGENRSVCVHFNGLKVVAVVKGRVNVGKGVLKEGELALVPDYWSVYPECKHYSMRLDVLPEKTCELRLDADVEPEFFRAPGGKGLKGKDMIPDLLTMVTCLAAGVVMRKQGNK